MGLAENFERKLYKEIQLHAAWFPVANTFKVGTYGLVEDGVLRPIGHIADDFGVDIGELETSAKAESVSFQSEGIRVVRTVAGGQVDVYPNVDVEAELNFEFTRSDSFLLKADSLVHQRMKSIQRVVKQLAEKSEWRRMRFRVVSGVYRAEAPVVMLAAESNTTFSFAGKASALKQLEVGNAHLSVDVKVSNKRSFQSIGKAGVIGLSLFRLGIGGGIRLLADNDEANFEVDGAFDESDL